ncbi:MAG: hypothetical protein ACQEST_06385 [Bacteroidota bacterium]
MRFRIMLFMGISIVIFCFNANAGSLLSSPFQVQHQAPTVIERHEAFELNFSASGINVNDVEEAYLFYRSDDDIAYSQKRASLVNSEFLVELMVENEQASSFEYYLEIHLNDGSTITYPSNKPRKNVIEVEVIDQQKSERERRVEKTGVDYTILSPEPGASVAQEDVVVALTLYYDPAEIDTSAKFKMYVDGDDVTDQATASDYFYTYSSDDLSAGTHKAEFMLEKDDSSQVIADWNFTVMAPGRYVDALTGQKERSGWAPQGNVELQTRSQQVGGYPNDALSGNVRLSGENGNVSYSAYGLLTTQEDSRLQPQNRYRLNLYVGNWLEFEAGHVYPMLNTFTIAGQRIQGANARFHFWDESLDLRFIYGKLRRGIDTIYDEITVEEQNFQEEQDPIGTYTLNTDDRGVFQRSVAGGRIGFKKDDTFNIGFNFLKVEDDTSSINLVNDFKDIMEVNPELASSLDSEHRQQLEKNPTELSVSGNPTPQGNFVAASDLEARLDNDRIQMKADAAVSLLNKDIGDGTLTEQEAEDMGFALNGETEDLLDRLSWLIIINENMETLPIRFAEDETDISTEIFFPTNILATQSQLGLSYFNNDLRFRYRWVGPGYNSLANTAIRKDIAGLSVTDRFRMFDNQIYVTLGYENLRDNVVNTKDATTATISYRGNVSWYPINQNFPRISMGLMKRDRDNDVSRNNPILADLDGVSEQSAVQNFVIENGDTLRTANPRLSNTYQLTASLSQEFSFLGIIHDASINYSLLNTNDQVFAFGDSESNSYSFRFVNQFPNRPLQTKFGFNLNTTETSGGLNEVQIMGVNIGGNMFFLDNKLNLDLSLAYTKNWSESIPLTTEDNGTPQESLDDYYKPGPDEQRTVTKNYSYIINTGAQYNLDENHSFFLDFKYSNVQNALASPVTYPNDHLMQFRYIFNF